MTELSDELLVAYVDGQLAKDQNRAVEKVLEQDEVMAKRAAALQEAHERLEFAFDSILTGELRTLLPSEPEDGEDEAFQRRPEDRWQQPASAKRSYRAIFLIGVLLGAAGLAAGYFGRPLMEKAQQTALQPTPSGPANPASAPSVQTKAPAQTETATEKASSEAATASKPAGPEATKPKESAPSATASATPEAKTSPVASTPAPEAAPKPKAVASGPSAEAIDADLQAGIAAATERAASAPQPVQARPTSWVDAVAKAQSLFSRESLEVSLNSQQNPYLLSFQLTHAIGPDVRGPDLRAEGYSFVRAQLLHYDGKPLAQMLYLPKTGEPLSLFAMKGGAEKPPVYKKEGAVGAVAWTQDGVAYVLAAKASRKSLLQMTEKILSSPVGSPLPKP